MADNVGNSDARPDLDLEEELQDAPFSELDATVTEQEIADVEAPCGGVGIGIPLSGGHPVGVPGGPAATPAATPAVILPAYRAALAVTLPECRWSASATAAPARPAFVPAAVLRRSTIRS